MLEVASRGSDPECPDSNEVSGSKEAISIGCGRSGQITRGGKDGGIGK